MNSITESRSESHSPPHPSTRNHIRLEYVDRLLYPDDPDSLLLIKRLIDIYRNTNRNGLKSLRTQAACAAWEVLSRTAHKLKSSSANLGAERAANLFKKLEEMDFEKANVLEIIDDLATETHLAEQELLEYLEVLDAQTTS